MENRRFSIVLGTLVLLLAAGVGFVHGLERLRFQSRQAARRMADRIVFKHLVFRDVPLAEAVTQLRQQSGVPIELDEAANDNAGDLPVNCELRDVSFNVAVEAVLAQVRSHNRKLCWQWTGGRIQVFREYHAPVQPMQTYDIRSLVRDLEQDLAGLPTEEDVPQPLLPPPAATGGGGLFGGGGGGGGRGDLAYIAGQYANSLAGGAYRKHWTVDGRVFVTNVDADPADVQKSLDQLKAAR